MNIVNQPPYPVDQNLKFIIRLDLLKAPNQGILVSFLKSPQDAVNQRELAEGEVHQTQVLILLIHFVVC